MEVEKRTATTLGPPGPKFWTFLVVIPTIVATCAGAITGSPSMAAEAYVLACLAIASLQAPCYVWWVVNVEGNLGMPRWVHAGAGGVELLIVALRIISYHPMVGDDSAVMMRTAAMVLTCGIMGGGFWVWFVVFQTPHCFAPAALLLLATLANKPIFELVDMAQIVSWAMSGSFVIGAGVAALVHYYYNYRSNGEERKTRVE